MLRRKKASGNKKVRNATACEEDGIKFRSKLELYTYRALKEAGIPADYEAHKYTLLEKFRFRGEAVRAMTYTPDFVSDTFIIECKGFANETFPLKWKLFKWFMHENRMEHDLYIVKTQKQVMEMIEDIKLKQKERNLLFEYEYTSEDMSDTSLNNVETC